ncbi:hypothetical protein [Amycolatopsis magusensis]|uniref:hypothetical protein n=1 Tax=Amycolatopsis magusensis TaxID=882444 RepID=UPI0024A92550|nr:hypothetical protein [Amycolatopsis magusensis]MDI5976800.1 hypothetical protein [Amycolatopsis magusensis]
MPHSRHPEFVPAEDFPGGLADLPRTDPAEFFTELDAVVDPDPFRAAGEGEQPRQRGCMGMT